MTRRFTAIVTKEEKGYVSRCVELGVVSQGLTIEEAQAKLGTVFDGRCQAASRKGVIPEGLCRESMRA